VTRKIREKVPGQVRGKLQKRIKNRQSLPKKREKNRREGAKYLEILLQLADSFFIALY
jgi:hypothetical protein